MCSGAIFPTKPSFYALLTYPRSHSSRGCAVAVGRRLVEDRVVHRSLPTTAPKLLPLPFAFAFALAFSSLAMGCGAAAMPAAEPSSDRFAPGVPPESPPRSAEEAQQRIDRARSEIDGSKAAVSPASKTPTTDVAPSMQPVPESPSAAGAVAPCSTPCRALGSMRRAVESLCELTGSADTRCVNAKKTLTESQAKVGPCSCE